MKEKLLMLAPSFVFTILTYFRPIFIIALIISLLLILYNDLKLSLSREIKIMNEIIKLKDAMNKLMLEKVGKPFNK